MITLMPRDGCRYLKPEEVVAKMQKAFAYVETTDEGARERVAAWLEQLAFVTGDGHRAAANQYMDQLEQCQDSACFIHFGNDLGADGICLSLLMIPHQPLIIEAHGQDDKTWELIYRAAVALDYVVFEDVGARMDSKGSGEYAAAA